MSSLSGRGSRYPLPPRVDPLCTHRHHLPRTPERPSDRKPAVSALTGMVVVVLLWIAVLMAGKALGQ